MLSIGQDYLNMLNEPFKLFEMADELCKELHGDRVTYVVNRNINFTDICVNSCRFCAFSNRRHFILALEEIAQKVEEAVDYGCTEVCIQGGLIPKAGLDFYTGILDTVRSVSSRIHIHAFSPMEIVHMSRNSNMEIEDVLLELKKSGLDSLPGTAAEILVDDVREKICPDKITTGEWVNVVKTAHGVGIPTTSTMMYGHVETWKERLEHLLLLKEIQRETGMITEFIPLPFMPHNNQLGRLSEGTSGFEDLLVIALSRIVLYPEIRNIQASWVKMGLKLAQTALRCGANDLGGTLMEENISKSAGADSGEFLSRKELERMIRVAGKTPVERDTLYRVVGK